MTRSLIRAPLLVVLAAGGMTTVACNPFRSPFKQAPVVQVTTRDANANARWNATLASPSALAGAVQMKGSAAMTPGSNSSNTDISIDLSNASPGGVHPWQLRRGQCGMDDGVFGSSDSYKTISIGDDGRGSATASVQMTTPTSGNYFVAVSASDSNRETVVACGNLAPPAQ